MICCGLSGSRMNLLTEPPFILRSLGFRINSRVVRRRAPCLSRAALKDLAPSNTPLELDVALPSHPGLGLRDHLASPASPIPEEVPDPGSHGPPRIPDGRWGATHPVAG